MAEIHDRRIKESDCPDCTAIPLSRREFVRGVGTGVLAASVPVALIALVLVARCSATSPTGSCAACATYTGDVLSVAGTHYAVGTSGDRAAIGRWSCGAPALALLRPSTGQVWLYSTWPTAAEPVMPTRGATVVGARNFAVQHGPRCDALFVVGARGARIRVTLPGAP